ncbi:c-type cytochrome [Nitratireductor thuwali]|uniref:Cytochrome c6 n=1 Tax=Nitratireductor thuwali TaxID=2267699 RepID=A0ABY5MLL5_9HYPH|nr:Cytochrome c6 [Nitratireductor thuwali]
MTKTYRHGRVALRALAILWSAGAWAGDGLGDEAGKRVFTSAEPACQVCHTLADADATGRVGPNLDNLQPSEDQVRNVVRGGADGMPPYGDRLSDEEIDAVAEYVAEVAGE